MNLDILNAGTVGQAPADWAQQNASIQAMTDYFKTELPSLGFALQQIKTEPAREVQAAGAGAETGREATASGIANTRAGAMARRTGFGSGNAIAGYTNALTRGAGVSGVGAAGGRSTAHSAGLATEQNVINSGSSLQRMGMTGLQAAAQNEDVQAQTLAESRAAFGKAIGNLIGGIGGYFGSGGGGGSGSSIAALAAA